MRQHVIEEHVSMQADKPAAVQYHKVIARMDASLLRRSFESGRKQGSGGRLQQPTAELSVARTCCLRRMLSGSRVGSAACLRFLRSCCC